MSVTVIYLTPSAMKVGGFYNWRHQTERLVYMGARRYAGDSRRWHQFAKAESPHHMWCEVMDNELNLLEEAING